MIEDKILTKRRFSGAVEYKARTFSSSYIDACLEVCDDFGLAPEDVGKVLSSSLHEKIEVEANRGRLLKNSGKTSSLPI